jgi:hypothetical protein
MMMDGRTGKKGARLEAKMVPKAAPEDKERRGGDINK